MVSQNINIISDITLDENGKFIVEFSSGKLVTFDKENFDLKKCDNNQGLIFFNKNKSFTIKMSNQNLDEIIYLYYH
jgi:hypothetical protein